MTITQYNRRNFLGSIAILSAGAAFGSTIKHFSPGATTSDLRKKWGAFWKLSGGQIYSLSNINRANDSRETKGHQYQYGQVIYFPQENILAQPTWIFWRNNFTKPADVIITVFENDQPFKKILRFNRYEMDALYRLSEGPGSEKLLSASINNSRPVQGKSATSIKIKTSIKKSLHTQDISYYKDQVLLLHKKFTYHS